ncbi:MAG: YheV family putative metal-binding protein [Pseudomonadales bacterium]|nr:YheV family putative metal-binding protein [Pseudomonadales bacterium]
MTQLPKRKLSRRFIAGASCPECKNIDTTYIDPRQETEFRVCIRCGFEEPREPVVDAKPLRFQ